MYESVLLFDITTQFPNVIAHESGGRRAKAPGIWRKIRECGPVKQIHTFCFAPTPCERTRRHELSRTCQPRPVALFGRG